MYPLEWQGQELSLKALTAGVKNTFCRWLKIQYLKEAKDLLSGAEYIQERERVLAGSIFWNNMMSLPVIQAIYFTDEGPRQLTRLLLTGKGVEAWTDEQVDAFTAARLASEDNPLALVWDMVMGEADAQKKLMPEVILTPTHT